MTDKKPIAPSLQDLSHAQVESSHLFGFTNVSGKALALLSLTSLSGGAAGVAQGLGYLGPVLGLSLTFPAGLTVLGASVVTGLLGYWLGNFDDKRIKEHNSRASHAFNSARGTVYERIEKGFLKALAKVEYDPKKNSLPYDALGYAVLLTDEKIGTLPPHVQLDIYRTQLDLELYKHRRLTSHRTVEGRGFEEAAMVDDATMDDKAAAYKRCRDFIRAAILNGTLSTTPVSGRSSSKAGKNFHGDGGADLTDVTGDVLEALLRTSRRGLPGGGFKPGGGTYGGGGASGSWKFDAPHANSSLGTTQSMQGQAFLASGLGPGDGGFYAPPTTGSGFDFDAGSLGSSGGSSNFDFGDVDLGEDGAPVLLVIAGIAAVVAASTVAGFSVWKNYISNADTPALGDVHLPMITKSLASAEKDIRRMYTPG